MEWEHLVDGDDAVVAELVAVSDPRESGLEQLQLLVEPSSLDCMGTAGAGADHGT